MTDAIPTRTVRLKPWLRTPGIEACFPTRRDGVLILKSHGSVLFNETLSLVRLQNRPPDGSFWTTQVQRLPDGGYALASPRSKLDEKNLHLFDDLGRYRTSFAIGDGIEHMAVDGKGRIWIGYFDEGIYGNDPLSSQGVSRFDLNGKLEYQWDQRKFGPIDDCYALTLDESNRAWICPYSSENFVAVVSDDDARILISDPPVSLISGLLSGRTHFGLLGGMDFHSTGDKAGAIIHLEPQGNRIEISPRDGPGPTNKESIVTIVGIQTGDRTQVQILDENATPLSFRNRVNCRAGTAICWTDDAIYRFTLDDLLTA